MLPDGKFLLFCSLRLNVSSQEPVKRNIDNKDIAVIAGKTECCRYLTGPAFLSWLPSQFLKNVAVVIKNGTLLKSSPYSCQEEATILSPTGASKRNC